MNRTEVDLISQSQDGITHEIPGTLRAVAVGAAIGVVFVFVAVGGALYLSQRDVGLALALGGMSAFWGGLGFGSMLGGTMHLIRHPDEPPRSTDVPASELRSLPAIEVPAASNERVAEPRTPEQRTAQQSAQVA